MFSNEPFLYEPLLVRRILNNIPTAPRRCAAGPLLQGAGLCWRGPPAASACGGLGVVGGDIDGYNSLTLTLNLNPKSNDFDP